MIKKIITTVCVALFVLTSVTAQVSSEVKEQVYQLLEKSDEILADNGDYSATMTLIVEQPDKPKETLQYKVFLKTKEEKMSMVQLFPEADKGIGYLKDGDNMWAYDPIGRKFSHTSVKEALGDSDVKIDDITRENDRWRKNFDVIDVQKGKLGKFNVNIITLQAITTDPSYSYIKLYMRSDIPLLLKEEDFSGSKRLMRTIMIPKYGKVPSG